ncbi:MAG: sensor histidine kinase [Ruthenibacterium sp.]
MPRTPKKIKSVFALFMVSLLLCFIVIGIAVMLFATAQTRSNLKRDTQERIDNAGKQADSTFNTLSSIYYSLLENSELLRFMSGPIGDRAVSLYGFFSPSRLYGIEADDFAMLGDAFDWSMLYSHEELLRFTKHARQASLVPVGLVQPVPTRSQHTQLVFVGGVYGQNSLHRYNQLLGHLFFSLRPESLVKSPLNSEIVPITYYLEDGNGILYPLSGKATDFELSDIHSMITAARDKGAQPLSAELQMSKGQKHYIYAYQIAQSNCKLIGITPIQSAQRQAMLTLLLVALIFIFIIALVLLLLRIVFRQIVEPVNQLDENIHTARKTSNIPITSIAPVGGCDEIVSLGSELNKLVQRNDTLNQSLLTTTQNLYQVEIEKERAEISHLRSQINPHFLYNTLEAIKGLALENGDTRIADISTAMGKMFRYSIKGENLVPLFDEIEIAKAYLQIQSTRFPGKINAVFSMADNVQNYYVNKMLLQPVLENSIVHGLTCVENGGILWVGGKCENDNMLLTVQDNGKGMSAETLAQIRAQLNAAVPHDGSGHIGLENVHRRIRLRYGAPYGVEITSEPNQGTRVVLRLPLLQSREESNGDVPCITCR